MGDSLEKSQNISSSYEAYENEALGMSVDPALVSTVASPEPEAASCDSHLTSDAYDRPAPITPDTEITVRGSQGQQQISVRNLLIEVGSGHSWARPALEDFLTNRLDQYDHSNLEMCFTSDVENIGDLMVQLKDGDTVQRREASKSILALILAQDPDAGEDLVALRRGLLVAAGLISDISDSNTFYEEVALLDSTSRQRLQAMSRDPRLQQDPRLLVTLRNQHRADQENNGNAPKNPAPANAQDGGIGALAVGSKSLSTNDPKLVATTAHTGNSNGVLGLINQTLLDSLNGSPEIRNILREAPGTALSTRLQDIINTPGLQPGQIASTLYIAILSKAVRHPDVVSAEDHYGEIRPVAANIASTLVNQLNLASEESLRLPGTTSDDEFASPILATNASPLEPSRGRTRVTTNLQNELGSSLGFFTQSSESGLPHTLGTVATSSTAAAGMMGINFFAQAGIPSLANYSTGRSNRHHYFIEAATAAEGDSNPGGQQQGGQQQGQQHGQNAYA